MPGVIVTFPLKLRKNKYKVQKSENENQKSTFSVTYFLKAKEFEGGIFAQLVLRIFEFSRLYQNIFSLGRKMPKSVAPIFSRFYVFVLKRVKGTWRKT